MKYHRRVYPKLTFTLLIFLKVIRAISSFITIVLKKRRTSIAAANILFSVSLIFCCKQAYALCSSPAGVSGQFQYDSSQSRYELCDGTNWLEMGDNATATSCSTAGQLSYISNVWHYCNGSVQVNMDSGSTDGSCSGTTNSSLTYDATDKNLRWCDGTNWRVVGNAAPPGGHYFVITSISYNGNLGGLSGANSKCLTDLQGNNWKGKSNVTLNSSTVKAFLCDGSTCQNAQASTTYTFARSGSTTAGGTTFTTNASGQGPGDTTTWSGSTRFGASRFWWSGRAIGSNTLWSNSPSGAHCTNWTSSSGAQSGTEADTGDTERFRWNAGSFDCSATNEYLVCLVDD